MRSLIKQSVLFAAVVLASPAFATPEADAARAEIQKTFGFVPTFMKQVPDSALPGAWQEMRDFDFNPNTALPGKVKSLISLAVAAQIPCRYCIYADTQFAKLDGATDAEVGEAVVMSALARKWSTVFNGLQLDETRFRAEVGQMITAAKNMKAPPPQIAVTDARSAFADAQANAGVVPEFMKRYPESGVAGAWNEIKAVEFAPNTALSPKYKSLISLAVASQVPCKYCTYADTEFARLDGATDKEIAEAVAVASSVRHWSTLFNGLQVDEAVFKKEVDRLVNGMKKSMAAAGAKGKSAP
jgi:AhpD family alkylhydroperoxidase